LISTSAAAKVRLQKATGINDACTIVANGVDLENEQPNVYVLTLINPSQCNDQL
jgi:hypothetical protein